MMFHMTAEADEFTPEELEMIKQCREYERSGWKFFPGHRMIMIVAKQARIIAGLSMRIALREARDRASKQASD